jgi:hypothetical protein
MEFDQQRRGRAEPRPRGTLTLLVYSPESLKSIAWSSFVPGIRRRVDQPTVASFDRQRSEDASAIGARVDPDPIRPLLHLPWRSCGHERS